MTLCSSQHQHAMGTVCAPVSLDGDNAACAPNATACAGGGADEKRVKPHAGRGTSSRSPRRDCTAPACLASLPPALPSE
eukprot:scaffold16743_cov129-Isochrysis_galbana.AAC.2